MCGIAGYFGNGNTDILKKMTDTLHYRGPDSGGFYIDKNIGLGHRRLSIIDLSSNGSQPMQSKKSAIVFNGEIYNYKNLQEKVVAHGIKLKGDSDTEVILHLYDLFGIKFLEMLNGMFAIAIHNKESKKIILARDRLGKKPLYWGIYNKTLIFGSEIKAILKHPEFKKELNTDSLNKFLQFEYIPTPNTIFKNLHKLEPASYLEYDEVKIKRNTFWKLSFEKNEGISKKEAIIELDKSLNNSVKSRLISDVPLGVFLSGGIDSSLIAYYAQKNSNKRIQTFSIGFSEKSFDESKKAELVAKHLKTEHHSQMLSAKDSLDIIPRIYSILDEPMADPSIIPTYLLSKFTKEKVTVALGGDGGDELFCGYDTFVAEKFAKVYTSLPEFAQNQIANKFTKLLPTSHKNISLDFKIKKFTQGITEGSKYRHQNWLGSFCKSERNELLSKELKSELKRDEFEEIDYYFNNTDSKENLDKLIHVYLRTYMMDDILVKVDRASMMNSLEVRTPFLDYKLVNFVNSLPNNFKIKGVNVKYLLKELAKNKLPKKIVNQKKKGFGIPLADWLSDELRPLCDDLLNKKRIKSEGIFNSDYIDTLLEQHYNRDKDNRKLIWTLLVFQMWQSKWK